MRFVRPGEVVLAWTEDETDPQYAMSLADLKVLEQETDGAENLRFISFRFLRNRSALPRKMWMALCLKREKTNGKQENGWLPVT